MSRFLSRFCLCVLAGLLAACQPPASPLQGGKAPASAIGSDKASFLLRLARASRAAGDAEAAANLYEQAAHASSGGDVTAALELAELQSQAGAKDKARKTLEDALSDAPEHAEALRKLANLHINSGQPGLAVPFLERALAKDAKDPKLYSSKGVALDMLGMKAEAKEAYRAGLAIAPDQPFLLTNLGMSYILSGEYIKAIETLEPVAQGSSSTPQARQNLAMAYGLSGDMEKAYAMGLKDIGKEEAEANLGFYQAVAETLPAEEAETRPEVIARAEEVVREPESLLDAPSHAGEQWFIEFGAYPTRAKAEAKWGEITQKHPELPKELCCQPQEGAEGHYVVGPFGAFYDVSFACNLLAGEGVECKLARGANP